MTIRSSIRGAGLATTLIAALAACNSETATREARCSLGDRPQLDDVVTSLAFDTSALTPLGVTVQSKGATRDAPQHSLSVLLGPASSYAAESECLAIDIDRGHITDFDSGRIKHIGGPTLTHAGATVDLSGFELRVGDEPRTFELFTAGGEHVLHAALPHYDLDPASGQIDIFNVDLHATPGLAARWGVPELAGYVVGTLTLRGKVVMPPAVAETDLKSLGIGAQATPQVACNDFSGNVDVALIGMDEVQQRDRAGDKVVITPSARLKNVGTANVPWQAKFSGVFPPYNTDQHPFLVWAIYRDAGGTLEMLANSDVKHAFLTINSNCDPGACTISSVLGLGCEDVYGVSTNGAHLGPRSEILPRAGTWAHCDYPSPSTPCHFDQTAPFCQQDNNGGNEPPMQHRLVVSDSELSVAGANYYFAAWYVVRDDINIFNSMGWRRIVPTLSGTTWTFGLTSPYVQGSALDAWVNPATPTANRINVTYKDPSAGSVQIAATATSIGGGRFRYVYAVQNHDFDPKAGSIAIPVAPSVTIEQPKFLDGDEDTSNDWLFFSEFGRLLWTAPTSSTRLSWGRMVTISFIANVAPSFSTVRLVRSDNGGAIFVKSLSVGVIPEIGPAGE